MILPHKQTVELGSGKLELRELAWPVMKEFLDKLANHVRDLAARSAADSPTTLAGLVDRLPQVVAESAELAEFLILKTAKRDVAWLAELGTTEFLAVLDGALAVTFNPEFLELGKSVAGRVSGLFSAPMTASPGSSTPSLPKAGRTRTPADSPSPSSDSTSTPPPGGTGTAPTPGDAVR